MKRKIVKYTVAENKIIEDMLQSGRINVGKTLETANSRDAIEEKLTAEGRLTKDADGISWLDGKKLRVRTSIAKKGKQPARKQ